MLALCSYVVAFTYDLPIIPPFFRLSRWNHTKVFSDFGDDETEDSEAESMDMKSISGRQSRATSVLKSDAHSLRSVHWCELIFVFKH